MRIGLVITPFNEHNLRLAGQIGVTDIVSRCPKAMSFESLLGIKKQVNTHHMNLSVIEGKLPLNRIICGEEDRDEDIEKIIELIRHMGKLDIEVLCYNFMPEQSFVIRTNQFYTIKGGARSSQFKYDALDPEQTSSQVSMTDDQMWDNLAYFLSCIAPVADECGVNLAMHPDDPPISPLMGMSRIMRDVPNFDKLLTLNESKSNGIAFCQGCFTEMGIDVEATVNHFNNKIHYIHFRDVMGDPHDFHEVLHGDGQTNLVRMMELYKQIGFNGILRPDHVPLLEGEVNALSETGSAGYSMQARIYAVGYMRALIDSVDYFSR